MTNDICPQALSPMTDIQKVLAEMWCDLLSIESVGPKDYFIEVGGDSVAAMLCAGRIRKLFGVELQLEEFFREDATLGKLAARLEELKSASESRG